MSSAARPLALAAFCLLALCGVSCSTDPAVAKQEHFDRAVSYEAEGKLPEAIIEYRNAVQIDPQFGRARFQLAEAYARSGNVQAAFGEYVRAADLLPDADVQLKAGNFLLIAGRYDEAKTRAEKVLAGDPSSTAGLVLRANALAGLKDLDGAVNEMERAIATDPNRGISYASLGAFELLRGNRADAEAAYAKAVESDPRSAAAHMALGAYRLALGQQSAAEESFRRAVDVEPQNLLALRALASAYLSSQQFAAAEPIVVRITEQWKDPSARLILADLHVAMNEIDKARTELQELGAQKDTAVPAKLRLAALDYTAGRGADAMAVVDDVLETHPKDAQALVLKGRLLLLERQTDGAIQQFEAAVAANGTYDLAHYWLGLAYAGRNRQADAERALLEAVRLTPSFAPAQSALSRLRLRTGDTTAALSFAQQATRNAPSDVEARVALVWALLGQKNLTRAAEELKPLAAARPNTSDVLVLQGTIDMMRKDPKAAEGSFAKALALQPNSPEALAGMLQTQLATGNLAGAEAQATAAIARAPSDAITLVLAARTYISARQLDRAEQVLRTAIETDPDQLDAYGLLGQLYVSQRRLDEAIREFDELSKRQANPVSAHTAVGMLLQASNRRPEAKARYEKVLAIDGSAAVAANNLAYMQMEDGENLDVALRLAQVAKSRLPESPEVNDTLGYIYYLKGLYPSARDAFKVSVEKDADNPLYHHRLGMTYARMGNGALAKQELSRALRLKPDFAGADEARATLASLS